MFPTMGTRLQQSDSVLFKATQLSAVSFLLNIVSELLFEANIFHILAFHSSSFKFFRCRIIALSLVACRHAQLFHYAFFMDICISVFYG